MSPHPTLTTTIAGEQVTLPGTLGDIRAALPDEQARAEFDHEIATAPIFDLPLIAARWALPAKAHAEDDAAVERIRSGDFTDLVNADGTPFVP